MLTRLKVRGFKNLVDVDIRFGAFTCIAGGNGVGKSNLFDAIAFLGALADKPLLEAALSVRDEGGRTGDVRSLFHRVGDTYADEISFLAEMIVPRAGTDDLGQKAEATITFLRYELVLGFRTDNGPRSLGGLELLKENLSHISKGGAPSHLRFPHSPKRWRPTAVTGHGSGHRSTPFISTEPGGQHGGSVIKRHQEGSAGRPQLLLAAQLPRTVLSAINASEGQTATMARREMQSWRILQLEPSALRQPDPFTAPARLGVDGSHLAATLYRLTRPPGSELQGGRTALEEEAGIYARVANRVSELIEDVRTVRVDRDELRELLTVRVTARDGTTHPARALSDGTLRFLALAVLELDPEATGVLCLEEPENGIHPARIPAMLKLLRAIATDVEEPLGPDNPLRQVIVNTHSPSVVAQVSDEDLVMADLRESVSSDGHRFRRLAFSCLPGTWRAKNEEMPEASRGALVSYLNPFSSWPEYPKQPAPGRRRRVMDRSDLQLDLGYREAV